MVAVATPRQIGTRGALAGRDHRASVADSASESDQSSRHVDLQEFFSSTQAHAVGRAPGRSTL